MEYPEDVQTKSKKGKVEVRALLDYGKFVRYEYTDPTSGKKSENKIKIVLYNGKEYEEYFIIPLKEKNKFLLLRTENKGSRKLWNGKESIELYGLL